MKVPRQRKGIDNFLFGEELRHLAALEKENRDFFKMRSYIRAERTFKSAFYDVVDEVMEGKKVPHVGNVIAEKLREFKEHGRVKKLAGKERLSPPKNLGWVYLLFVNLRLSFVEEPVIILPTGDFRRGVFDCDALSLLVSCRGTVSFPQEISQWLEVFRYTPRDMGKQLILTTGPENHLRELAEIKPLDAIPDFKTEKEIYEQYFGIQYVEPEVRDWGLRKRDLVSVFDFRNDLAVSGFYVETSAQAIMEAMVILRRYDYAGFWYPSVLWDRTRVSLQQRIERVKKVQEDVKKYAFPRPALHFVEVSVKELAEFSEKPEDFLLVLNLKGVKEWRDEWNGKVSGVVGPVREELIGSLVKAEKLYYWPFDPYNFNPEEAETVREFICAGGKVAAGSGAVFATELHFMDFPLLCLRRSWARPENSINAWDFEEIREFLKLS